jgi:small multidrug resistance family-3 protein
MNIVATAGLFARTAIAEILGCYLPDLWLRHNQPAWLLVPAAISLAVFSLALLLSQTQGAQCFIPCESAGCS